MSSYGRLWPPPPASSYVIKSNDVYATATTPLSVITGTSGSMLSAKPLTSVLQPIAKPVSKPK